MRVWLGVWGRWWRSRPRKSGIDHFVYSGLMEKATRWQSEVMTQRPLIFITDNSVSKQHEPFVSSATQIIYWVELQSTWYAIRGTCVHKTNKGQFGAGAALPGAQGGPGGLAGAKPNI